MGSSSFWLFTLLLLIFAGVTYASYVITGVSKQVAAVGEYVLDTRQRLIDLAEDVSDLRSQVQYLYETKRSDRRL